MRINNSFITGIYFFLFIHWNHSQLRPAALKSFQLFKTCIGIITRNELLDFFNQRQLLNKILIMFLIHRGEMRRFICEKSITCGTETFPDFLGMLFTNWSAFFPLLL